MQTGDRAVQQVRADVLAGLLRAADADSLDVAGEVLAPLARMLGATWMGVFRRTDRLLGGDPTWQWRTGAAGRTGLPVETMVVDDGRSHARVEVRGCGGDRWPSGSRAVVEECVALLLVTLDRLSVAASRSRAEQLLRRALDELDQIVYVYDPVSVSGLYVNRSYERLYGLDRDTWLKDPLVFLDSVHPDDRQAVVDVVAEARSAVCEGRTTDLTDTVRAEFRAVAPDGTVRWLTTRAFPLLDGSAPLMVGVTEDVTAERELGRALTQARLRAEAANRAKSRFLSRMSHELRTPLHAILGYAQLIELGTDDPRRLDQLGRIRRAGEHLVGLVDDVLDIARIEEGALSFAPGPVPAAAVVREALDLVASLVAARDAEVTLALDVAAVVHADHRRLVEVLVNLLSNAVTHGPDGGRVVARVSAGEDTVTFEVADRGPGLTRERLEQAFEPFERLDAGADVPGTGLGLTLVKALVEGMGGVLGVASEPGEGATFSVVLPRSAAPLPHPTAMTGTPTAVTDRLVLCVEDDADSARVLVEAVTRLERTRALWAGRGELALSLARAHRPDVVLLDRHLPDRSGEEVLAELRSDPATAPCRVVIVSADATQAARTLLLEAGADAYLTKPLDLLELYRVLDDLAAAGSS